MNGINTGTFADFGSRKIIRHPASGIRHPFTFLQVLILLLSACFFSCLHDTEDIKLMPPADTVYWLDTLCDEENKEILFEETVPHYTVINREEFEEHGVTLYDTMYTTYERICSAREHERIIIYLNDKKTHDFLKKLGKHLGSTINISRIKVGKKQAIETLINEESLLFAKYLRRERKKWIPRLA